MREVSKMQARKSLVIFISLPFEYTGGAERSDRGW